jgi:segregation and condensation protein A
MPYQVKLPTFEGPFDLLLFLIKKNEIDVYDIPIAEITQQYLEYIELMKILDLDIAGEFIEMVATLLLIKVRMLLPSSEGGEMEEIEDPRSQLVAQLLEYKQFKEASSSFGDLEYHRRKYFPRATPKESLSDNSLAEDGFLEDVSLFALLTAFKTALDNMPKVTVHQVNMIKVTLEDQVGFIIKQLQERPYILFREICKPLQSKMELIVTFMAVLDLIRLHFFAAKQSEIFGEIRLVLMQQLTMQKYLDVRDQDLMPETSKLSES